MRACWRHGWSWCKPETTRHRKSRSKQPSRKSSNKCHFNQMEHKGLAHCSLLNCGLQQLLPIRPLRTSCALSGHQISNTSTIRVSCHVWLIQLTINGVAMVMSWRISFKKIQSLGGGRGPHSQLGDLHHGQAARKAVFGRVFNIWCTMYIWYKLCEESKPRSW